MNPAKPLPKNAKTGKVRVRQKPVPDKHVKAALSDEALDDQERMFVAHYLANLDAQQAALNAGYSMSTATSKAYIWLTNPSHKYGKLRIYNAVKTALRKTERDLGITRERVLQGLAELAFSNVLDFGRLEDGQFVIDFANTSRSHAAAIQEVTVQEKRRTAPAKPGAQAAAPVVTERTTKLKLADKRMPLVDLGRHLGVFKDEGPVATNVTFFIDGLEVETK